MRWAFLFLATVVLSGCGLAVDGGTLLAEVLAAEQEKRTVYCQAESGAVFRGSGTICHEDYKLVSRATYDEYQRALNAHYCRNRSGAVHESASG